ncbi:MAG TPA: YbjQ family protein [Gemmatimonadota bacterium]|nr:YbjQ family protein [Gemmatimonadota bacterium]
MIITPSADVPGRRTVKSHGLVRGNTIRARHIGKDILAALRNMIGGEVREYTKMMAEAREQAIDRMVEEAESLGANAVVNVRFTTAYVMGQAAEILVFGDAVQLEPEP